MLVSISLSLSLFLSLSLSIYIYVYMHMYYLYLYICCRPHRLPHFVVVGICFDPCVNKSTTRTNGTAPHMSTQPVELGRLDRQNQLNVIDSLHISYCKRPFMVQPCAWRKLANRRDGGAAQAASLRQSLLKLKLAPWTIELN